MAFPDNLASDEAWIFRPALPDAWISEAFFRDAELVTKALQKTIADSYDAPAESSISEMLSDVKPETPLSGRTGSDSETVFKRSTLSLALAPSGKVTKRKSRVSKRSSTMFIMADPANFRHMVQQVTGVRIDNLQVPVAPILEPELPADGCVGRLQGFPPTFDTSAFLLDHQHQQAMVPAAAVGTQEAIAYSTPTVTADGVLPGLDFDSKLVSFPTLGSL
ncbi:hypothetical protein Nepgr_009938 [Nepenthes gracilis]|uniref:VQ domain-containing protein n=1 Tax=Nepenthes gracilis TaxID=150966 RepID=A0AAD3XKL3_NEPGR|nr:hypothetical protein Nepgr_009938 [Nepenthes gracilis]